MFLIAFAVLLFGNGSHSLWDRDEPRFAEAGRNLVESGDWVVPKFNGRLRADKPILVYWLMAPAIQVLGPTEIAVRMPSTLGGALLVATMFLLAARMGASRAGARFAALLTLFLPHIHLLSKAATADGFLLFTIGAAMTLLWEQWRSGSSLARTMAFWAVLALCVLEKGPVGLAFVGGAALALQVLGWQAHRRGAGDSLPVLLAAPPSSTALPQRPAIAPARIALGLVLFLALALPWAVLVYQRTQGEFFAIAFGKHVVGRATDAMEGHGGANFLQALLYLPYYIPVTLGGLLPFLPVMLAALAWLLRNRASAQARFLLAWFVPGFMLISLNATKLPHYVAGLLPAFAIAAGLFLTALERTADPATAPDPVDDAMRRALAVLRGSAYVLIALSAALAIVALLAAVALPAKLRALLPPGFPLVPACGALLALACGLGAAGIFAMRGRARASILAAVAGLCATLLVAFGVLLPALEQLRPSRQLAAWARANLPPGVELMASRFQEPSLVFYYRGRITMLSSNLKRENRINQGASEGELMLARLRDTSRPWALVIPESRWGDWQSAIAKDPALSLGVNPQVLHRGEYFDFQKGGPLTLLVIGSWPASQPPSVAPAASSR